MKWIFDASMLLVILMPKIQRYLVGGPLQTESGLVNSIFFGNVFGLLLITVLIVSIIQKYSTNRLKTLKLYGLRQVILCWAFVWALMACFGLVMIFSGGIGQDFKFKVAQHVVLEIISTLYLSIKYFYFIKGLKKSQSEGYKMKTTTKKRLCRLLIVGILLILFGGAISFGVAVEFFEGTSEYPVGTEIAGLVLLGVGPIVGGLFLCRRALTKRGDS
jgi:hypothetical protein